jgi:HK97 family phage major capsid protein
MAGRPQEARRDNPDEHPARLPEPASLGQRRASPNPEGDHMTSHQAYGRKAGSGSDDNDNDASAVSHEVRRLMDELTKASSNFAGFAAARKSAEADLSARLRDVEQKIARRGSSTSLGSTGGSDFGPGQSFGSQVEEAFKADADLFKKTRRIGFEIKAGEILGGVVGRHGSRDLAMAPGAASTSLSVLLSPGPLEGLATLHYPRRTGVIGGADVQATEGAAKDNAAPVFVSIAQNAATVAGWCVVSEQALNTEGTLSRAVNGHLSKAIRIAIDNVLVTGTTATAWPFAGFVTLATAFAGPAGFTSLVDGILAAKARMNSQGFNPTIVVLNEAGWLGTQLAKDTTGRYLTDAYLAALTAALGGMKVALSEGVPAGKGMLIDEGFNGYLWSGAVRISMGLQDDQFIRNLVTVRAEVEVLPYATDYESLLLATPAVA